MPPSESFLFQGSGAKVQDMQTMGVFDFPRYHEALNLILHHLWLRGVGRVLELALKIKDNCFADPIRLLQVIGIHELALNRKFAQFFVITSLMVDLQTLPKVLPVLEEIEFQASSRMVPTSLGKPCHLRKHESVIKNDKF